MVRLAMLDQSSKIKYLRKELLKGKDIGLTMVDIGSRADVAEDIIAASIRQVVFPNGLVRSRTEFDQQLKDTAGDIVTRANAIETILLELLKQIVAIRAAIKSAKNPLALTFASGDINQQLSALFYRGFLFDTEFEQLRQYKRYLQAVMVRIEKVPQNINRDKQFTAEIQDHWHNYQALTEQKGRAWVMANPALLGFRWSIEELRVSLFAQTLKTAQPVSPKRLSKAWSEIVTNL
jgi:ATP-dependent helicase HrpA